MLDLGVGKTWGLCRCSRRSAHRRAQKSSSITPKSCPLSTSAIRSLYLCRFALKSETWRLERRVLSLIARFGCLWACASGALLRNMINCVTQTWLSLEGAQESNPCIVVDAVADDGCFSQGISSSVGDCGEAEQPNFRSGLSIGVHVWMPPSMQGFSLTF